MDMDRKLRLVPKIKKVKNYREVVSGGEEMTLVPQITGGTNARLALAFFIFKDANRSYPIQGVSNVDSSVSYRAQPRAWLDRI